MLQLSFSELSPSHWPPEDCGTSNVRCRILCPPLQDFEHELHSVHSFQMQLAEKTKKLFVLIELAEPMY